MNGLEIVVAMRRQRVKPAAVYVDLMPGRTSAPTLSKFGIVTVEIFPEDSISSIDFRPLVGLDVMVNDYAGSPKRARSASKAIAHANPRTLVVPASQSGVWTIHRRFAGDPPTTDRTTLHEA